MAIVKPVAVTYRGLRYTAGPLYQRVIWRFSFLIFVVMFAGMPMWAHATEYVDQPLNFGRTINQLAQRGLMPELVVCVMAVVAISMVGLMETMMLRVADIPVWLLPIGCLTLIGMMVGGVAVVLVTQQFSSWEMP